MPAYCAYVHARPNTIDASGIFYVGKGTHNCAMNIERNKHHSNVVAKHGKENILIGKLDCSSEEIAFQLEIGLIKCLKIMGVNLTNQTDGGDGGDGGEGGEGGEGVTGMRHTNEAKFKIGKAAKGNDYGKSGKGRVKSIEECKNISLAKMGHAVSEETRLKLSMANIGKPPCFLGKTHSEETKEKIRIAKTGSKMSIETKLKMSQSRKEYFARIKAEKEQL